MSFEELERLFLRSRERGREGARKFARPRTLESYRWDLKWFFEFMRERGIITYEAMKRPDVLDFLDSIQDNKNISDATRYKILRSVRALFRWVEKSEDCQEDGLKPWYKLLPPIPKTPSRKVIPERKDMKAFKAAFNVNKRSGYRNYVAFSLMLETGMRVGELCHLKLEHLKLDEQTIIVPEEGKTNMRLVGITKDMVRLMKGWLRRREHFAKSDRVFVNQSGEPATVFMFDHAFAAVRRRLGIKTLSPHTLRHACCTLYLENGGDIGKLQSMTGHKSLDVLKGYLHISTKYQQEELERVSPLKNL